MELRNMEIEERESFYKEFSLYSLGKTHKKIRNVYNINNNKKPNPNRFIVLESYDSIRKALLNNVRFDYIVVCPELAVTSEAVKVVTGINKLTKEGYLVSKKTYDSIIDKSSNFGVLAIVKFPEVELKTFELKDSMRIVILDGLEVQGNVGTIIRTADGAGADLVILTNKRIRVTHPKFIRASMGTVLNVPIAIAEMDETIKWLKDNGFKLYLTDTRAEQNYDEPEYSGRVAVIAGSEKFGIMKAWYNYKNTELIKLPMLGQADSLNVGVATSIMLYEVLRKQNK